MTDAQRAARKQSAESGKIRWIKDHCLFSRESKEDYVFISYKSDDYQQVLDGIVYDTCRKYGLKVYFDAAFDDVSDLWIKQFYNNMGSIHCKGMIAFLSNKYYSSYAALMEMMARKTREAGGDYNFDSLFFLPINLEHIVEISSEDNTGLGTERFQDGRINAQAVEELDLFNALFRELADADSSLNYIYKRSNDNTPYSEPTAQLPRRGAPYLTVSQCRKLMHRVCPKSNENDGQNKDFPDVIYDKLTSAGLDSVFLKPPFPWDDNPGPNPRPHPGPDPGPHPGPDPGPHPAQPQELSPDTTLKQFAELCEFPEFCRILRTIRGEQKKQFFDYLLAALLRGCDQKAEETSAGWTYCTYAVSSNLNLENPKMGASQFTWQSNSRKAVNIPKAGKLGWRSQAFQQLEETMTLAQIMERFRTQEPFSDETKDPFCTKDNALIRAALSSILNSEELIRFSRDNWPGSCL